MSQKTSKAKPMRCMRKLKNGKQCTNIAQPGSRACRRHNSEPPQSRVAVKEVIGDLSSLIDDNQVDLTPVSVLTELLQQKREEVSQLREKVKKLGDANVGLILAQVEEGSSTKSGDWWKDVKKAGYAPEVKALWEAQRDLERLASTSLHSGIEVAQTKLLTERSKVFALAMRDAIRMARDFPDLSEDALVRALISQKTRESTLGVDSEGNRRSLPDHRNRHEDE